MNVEQANKLRIGQKVYFKGIEPSEVVSVNRVSNQYATIILGFEVLWDGEKKPMPYEPEHINENIVHLEKRVKS